MRQLLFIAFAAMISACALETSACTLGSGTNYVPATPTMAPTPVLPSIGSQSARFVYVADQRNDELDVYPFGARGAAQRSVQLGSAPRGVAVGADGEVYVTLGGSSQVAIFSPGAQSRIGTITDALYEPGGVTLDSAGALYVVNRSQGDLKALRALADESAKTHGGASNTYIEEYAPGTRAVVNQIVSPPGTAFCGGVAVDANGAVYAVALESGFFGAFLVEAWPTFKVEPVNFGGCGGVAMGVGGNFVGGALGVVQTLSPSFRRVRWQDLEPDNDIRNLTDTDGNVAIPLTNPNDGRLPAVIVEPSSASATYRISLPSTAIPVGAAVGP